MLKQIEKRIESLIDKKIIKNLSKPEKLGRVKRLETGTNDYIEILKKNFTKKFNLKGLRIVIDCANGAGYKAGPELLKSLGAKVISIGVNPNGLNINKNCGSTFPKKIKTAVKKYKANITENFSILINSGPGSFSSIRVSLAVAKGIKISKKINLYGFKNSDLGQFNLANIELLIKKNLIQKNLIKPLYIS